MVAETGRVFAKAEGPAYALFFSHALGELCDVLLSDAKVLTKIRVLELLTILLKIDDVRFNASVEMSRIVASLVSLLEKHDENGELLRAVTDAMSAVSKDID